MRQGCQARRGPSRCPPPNAAATFPSLQAQQRSSHPSMACLAFGRATLLSHPSFGNRQADDAEWRHQLTVQNDLARITQENAVFDALAQQVTAFVCNLDEATVNCGAAEPHTIHISSSSGSGSSAGGSLSRSSSRGTSSGGAGDGSGTRSPAGCNSSDSSPAALASSHFRRLRAFPHRRSGA